MFKKVIFLLSAFFAVYSPLGFVESAEAARHCYCKARDASGTELNDYGAIDSYGIFETGVEAKCRFSCITMIQDEVVLQPSWNGTWTNAANLCAWTGNTPENIIAKYKVGTGSWISDATNDLAVDGANYNCLGEPCPSADYFAPQTTFGPYTPVGQPALTTYNDSAVITKDGSYSVAGLNVAPSQDPSPCTKTFSNSYKCVYYHAQSGNDQCLGLNPPAYTPGATPVADTTVNISCPPAKKPTLTLKVNDDSFNYFGITAQSSLDNCEVP